MKKVIVEYYNKTLLSFDILIHKEYTMSVFYFCIIMCMRKIYLFFLGMIFSFSFFSFWQFVFADECDWIKLNTKIPFLWDCIEANDATSAFPKVIWALTKMVMSIILIVCFICVIIAWIMISSWNVSWWKKLIIRVAWTIWLIWTSGAILRLINPNFFT